MSKYTNLLLISQASTPNLPHLPLARKETRDLRVLMEGTAVNVLFLEDSEVTRESVKERMKTHGWVHFACHGEQDIHQPLMSGLFFQDGSLELLEIMNQRIPYADFAFLSVSESSKGDPSLSEEVVHLTAGMLSAGYRGVVGTMWSIYDIYGPEFATEFYQYLLRENKFGGLDSTRAAYALDYATRTVRERFKEDDIDIVLWKWVPYVHFGY